MGKEITTAKPIINKKIISKVNSVLQSRLWVQGKAVEELENSIASLVGAKYAVVVNSGTAALHTLLLSFSFDKDDEIITSPFTFVGTANAIVLSNAKPVFADISAIDFNLDYESVEKKITKKTKAILTVDLYGQTANYKKLSELAKKYNLILLSDSAQAIGALHYSKPVNKYVAAAIFSLYATKNIAAGEGGVIVTDDKKIASFARSFRNQGLENGSPTILGLNYRMTDILAVIALEQIRSIEEITEKRRKIASYYNKNLKNLDLQLPKELESNFHVYHQYTIRIKNRDIIREKLKQNKIMTGVFYFPSLHLLKHFRFLGYKKGDLPVAEEVSEEVLSLPIHFSITRKDQNTVIKELRKILLKP